MNALTSLQMGRGFAATLVVLFHINNYFFSNPKFLGQQFHPIFGFGYAGVEFFFVLSGFLMAHIHMGDFGRPERLGNYALKRFIRIYPFYWIALCAWIALTILTAAYGLAPQSGILPDWTTVLKSFALVPTEETPIIVVAWTLQFEIAFYALFALTIWRAGLGSTVLAVWLSACLIALAWPDIRFPFSFLLSSYNILFFLGIGAAFLVRRQIRPYPVSIALIGVVTFLATGVQDIYSPVRMAERFRILSFGLGSFLMIWGLVSTELQGRLSAPRLLKLLGDASYSIYLAHGMVLTIAMHLLLRAKLLNSIPPSLLFLGLLILALGSTTLIHLWIEKPLTKRLSEWRATFAVRSAIEPSSRPLR